MKSIYLSGVGLVSFVIYFQTFCTWFWGGVKVWYKKWDFWKVFKKILSKDFGKLYVQSGDKFQCADYLL